MSSGVRRIEACTDKKVDQIYHDHLIKDFIGLDTQYKVANGSTIKRIYLDTTASSLMMGVAHRAANKFLKHALEWDYFVAVISFYLLTFFMWKKNK